LKLELIDVRSSLELLADNDQQAIRLPHLNCPTWEKHRDVFATELTSAELETLHWVFRWLKQYETPQSRRMRMFGSSGPIVSPDELRSVRNLTALAIGAVDGVARRGGKLIRRRKDRLALAPSLRASCRCGHAFGQHRWKTRRRLLRTKSFHVKHVDHAFECHECDCSKFRYDDPSTFKAILRRLRVLDQAPTPNVPRREQSADDEITDVFTKVRTMVDVDGFLAPP
jgi:hypothetical protein